MTNQDETGMMKICENQHTDMLSPIFANVVVRDVRDRYGNKLGTIVEAHDGSEASVIRAAKRASQRMFAEYYEASNIQSRIGATDATGKPKWSISPNLRHLAEIDTDEARYIWGDLQRRAQH